MPIAGLEVEDDALSGQISILSGNQYLGKKLLPFPITPQEMAQKAQTSFWDMLIASIKKKLGL